MLTGEYYQNDGFSAEGYDYYHDSQRTVTGCFYKRGSWVLNVSGGSKEWKAYGIGFNSENQIPSQLNRSNNETRPKTKFFNFLIYAGYPNY